MFENLQQILSDGGTATFLLYGGIITLVVAGLFYEPVYTVIGRFFKGLSGLIPPDVSGGIEKGEAPTETERLSSERGPMERVGQSVEIETPAIGVWQGFKFGFGFAAGFLFFYTLLFIALMFIFGAVISSILSTLTHFATFPMPR